jgi:small subunit ribosomal protein S16
MVKIRLRRVGAKKQPSYRVVVADSRSPRNGRFIETIGFYNPRTEPLTVEIKEDRALYWLSQGAQPTEAVAGLFNRLGTMDRLARLRKGEALDGLLSEAAAAHQQLAEKASTPEAQVEIQQAAEAAEAEVAGVEQETQGVAVADLEENAKGTEDVANAEEAIQPAEEEA